MEYEAFEANRIVDQRDKQHRRQVAAEQFGDARALAHQHGMVLRRCGEAHYQLFGPGPAPWVQNIYPGNRRLYWDRQHARPPYVVLPEEWTLLDVVKAAISEMGKEPPC